MSDGPSCLLYTSDAADEARRAGSVGRRIIKIKNTNVALRCIILSCLRDIYIFHSHICSILLS
ncbi:hypothetical protein PVA38_11410 [Streptococcus pneumoniae D39]|nr:hypothetical protein PVA38_11410 [Streptococcus pneumoniae D39]